MRIEITKNNKAVSVGSRAFKSVDAKNLKTYGYSCIVLDGNVLRASDSCEVTSKRLKRKRALVAKKKAAKR